MAGPPGCRPDRRLPGNGPPRGVGRPPGTPNKIGRQAKENIIEVFSQLGGIKAMTNWARRNKTEFYKLYARLIPVTVHAAVDVRHASEYSDAELVNIIASEGGSRIDGEASGNALPDSVH
jgi:hypothetical protein